MNVNLRKRRRLASAEEVKFDLNQKLPLFNKAFYMAVDLFNKEINQTPPSARVKSFEATLLNAKMVQALQICMPDTFSFGKYKRIVGSFPGYQVLVKKLNGKGLPMNIKTANVNGIMNQAQLSLFDSPNDVEDAVLFFGYEKDKIGDIINPQLVYIDEGQIAWRIDLDKYESGSGDTMNPIITMPIQPTPVAPRLRAGEQVKKAQ